MKFEAIEDRVTLVSIFLLKGDLLSSKIKINKKLVAEKSG